MSTAFADDVTLILKSNKELRAAEISGLEINFTKSEVMELNYKYHNCKGIPLTKEVKITGIYFSLNEEMMSKRNWEEVYNKAERAETCQR